MIVSKVGNSGGLHQYINGGKNKQGMIKVRNCTPHRALPPGSFISLVCHCIFLRACKSEVVYTCCVPVTVDTWQPTEGRHFKGDTNVSMPTDTVTCQCVGAVRLRGGDSSHQTFNVCVTRASLADVRVPRCRRLVLSAPLSGAGTTVHRSTNFWSALPRSTRPKSR